MRHIVFFALIVFTCSLPAKDALRPNIVLIMADDMGFSDIGCYRRALETGKRTSAKSVAIAVASSVPLATNWPMSTRFSVMRPG